MSLLQKMSQKIPLYYALPVILLSTLLVAAVIWAWTEPTVAPPGDNVPAPINVGNSAQIKSGALQVNGFRNIGTTVLDSNVGIGTTTPAYKLDVSGDVRWTGTLQGGSVSWARLISFPSACPGGQYVSGIGSALTCLPLGGGGDGTANYLTKFTATTTIGNSQIFDNGTNVGIGTTAPDSKLELGAGGAISINEGTVTPATPALGAEARIYVKGDKLIIQWNDLGTVRYKYLLLSGTGVTWVHTTTAP